MFVLSFFGSFFPLTTHTCTVYVKKNATNATRRHLKTWCQERRFSPTMCGTLSWPRCSMPSLVKCRNSRIATLFAVKMRRIQQIAARLAKILVRLTKSAAMLYSGTSRTNPEETLKSAACSLIRLWHTNFTNCCILFEVYSICTCIKLDMYFLCTCMCILCHFM